MAVPRAFAQTTRLASEGGPYVREKEGIHGSSA
jgi:hypothetical protein